MNELRRLGSWEGLVRRLSELQARRRRRHKANRGKKHRRKTLTAKQRKTVRGKTAGRCHICGGRVEEGGPERKKWQADHVLAHNRGGRHSIENYLPAHALCNNYRWDYGSEEFQWILKIGVWARTLMRNGSRRHRPSGFGREMVEAFFKHESGLEKRRKH